jgi:hypothetical protein
MRTQSRLASRSLYGVVWLGFAPIFGILLLGLSISWNTTPAELYSGMLTCLGVLTCCFLGIFVVLAVAIWDANSILAFVDLAMCISGPFLDYFWFNNNYSQAERLTPPHLTVFCSWTMYMTVRLWYAAVAPRYRSWKSQVETSRSASALDRLVVCRRLQERYPDGTLLLLTSRIIHRTTPTVRNIRVFYLVGLLWKQLT